MLLVAVGLGFSFVPISIAALAGVQPAEAGLASGLINTSQQIGGALGIAALSAIATSTTTGDLSSGTDPAFALTNGFQDAFIAGAIIAFVGVLVSVFVVRGRDLTRRSRKSSRPSSRPPSSFEWAAGHDPAAHSEQDRLHEPDDDHEREDDEQQFDQAAHRVPEDVDLSLGLVPRLLSVLNDRAIISST